MHIRFFGGHALQHAVWIDREARSNAFRRFDWYIRNNAPQEEADKYWEADRNGRQLQRENWFSKQLKVEKEKYIATITMKQKDTHKGKFMTARKVSEELGGDPIAAMRYCKSCIVLGPSEYYLEGLQI